MPFARYILPVSLLAALSLAAAANATAEITNAYPDGATTCKRGYRGWTVEVGSGTSCAMGRATAKKVTRRTELADDATFRTAVKSPATGKTYRLRCSVSAGGHGSQILCTSARVYVNLYRYY